MASTRMCQSAKGDLAPTVRAMQSTRFVIVVHGLPKGGGILSRRHSLVSGGLT